MTLCNVLFALFAFIGNINGPETAEPGDPVVFSTELKDPKWEVYPDQATNGKCTYIQTSDGSLVFCTYPGTYVIFNSGLDQDGKHITSKKVFHVGGTPPAPKPPAPPIPPPELPALTKLVKENLSLVPDEIPKYKKLGTFFQDPQVSDISQLQLTTKTKTHEILGDTTKWAGVMITYIAPYLKQQNATTLEDNLKLWKQIGDGIMEACK